MAWRGFLGLLVRSLSIAVRSGHFCRGDVCGHTYILAQPHSYTLM